MTVTNTFENKTADALGAISPNLIAAEPGIEAVAAALGEAAARADDVDAAAPRQRTCAGAATGTTSFSEPVLDAGAQPARRLTPRAGTGEDCTIDDVVWP